MKIKLVLLLICGFLISLASMAPSSFRLPRSASPVEKPSDQMNFEDIIEEETTEKEDAVSKTKVREDILEENIEDATAMPEVKTGRNYYKVNVSEPMIDKVEVLAGPRKIDLGTANVKEEFVSDDEAEDFSLAFEMDPALKTKMQSQPNDNGNAFSSQLL